MRYDQPEDRKAEDFQRLTGVKPQVFAQMLEAVRGQIRVFGRPCKLPLSDQLLLTLMVWREHRSEHRSMASIAVACEVSEPTVQRTIVKIEGALLASGGFALPGKKALRESELAFEVVVVDATQCPQKTAPLLQKANVSRSDSTSSPRSTMIISGIFSN